MPLKCYRDVCFKDVTAHLLVCCELLSAPGPGEEKGCEPAQMEMSGWAGSLFKMQKPRQLGTIQSQQGKINIKKRGISLIFWLLNSVQFKAACFEKLLQFNGKRNSMPSEKENENTRDRVFQSKLSILTGLAQQVPKSEVAMYGMLHGFVLCH